MKGRGGAWTPKDTQVGSYSFHEDWVMVSLTFTFGILCFCSTKVSWLYFLFTVTYLLRGRNKKKKHLPLSSQRVGAAAGPPRILFFGRCVVSDAAGIPGHSHTRGILVHLLGLCFSPVFVLARVTPCCQAKSLPSWPLCRPTGDIGCDCRCCCPTLNIIFLILLLFN